MTAPGLACSPTLIGGQNRTAMQNAGAGRRTATGATAGIPGSWTPAGSAVPANQAAVIGSTITASPATPWTTGQYVQTQTAGAAGRVTWTGSAWVGGAAP